MHCNACLIKSQGFYKPLTLLKVCRNLISVFQALFMLAGRFPAGIRVCKYSGGLGPQV